VKSVKFYLNYSLVLSVHLFYQIISFISFFTNLKKIQNPYCSISCLLRPNPISPISQIPTTFQILPLILIPNLFYLLTNPILATASSQISKQKKMIIVHLFSFLHFISRDQFRSSTPTCSLSPPTVHLVSLSTHTKKSSTTTIPSSSLVITPIVSFKALIHPALSCH